MYLYGVMLLSSLVELLLLLAANRLTGCPPAPGRCLLAALLGGLYSGACLLPQLQCISHALWRCGFLCLLGIVAFGWHSYSLRRTALFLFLSMALEGTAAALGGYKDGILPAAAAVLALSFLGFPKGRQELVEVELSRGDKHTALLALRDTGNRLTDPVTGQRVLVADDRSAETLLGLTRQQLRSPAETVASGVVPGLRLIPYRAVGQAAGLLVAIRLDKVRIGKWEGSSLVAFAPEGLGGNYRALTGGTV